MFVCLFGVFRPTWEFFTHLDTSPLPMKGCNFLSMLAIMAIEQWVVFSVSHVLWHGASIYNGHLRGLVTLTPFAERLAVELSLPDLTTYVYRGLDSNTQPSACGANAVTHYATAVTLKLIKCKHTTIHRTFFKNVKHIFLYIIKIAALITVKHLHSFIYLSLFIYKLF